MPFVVRLDEAHHRVGGDGGIDGIAAALEDLDAGARGQRLARGDDAVCASRSSTATGDHVRTRGARLLTSETAGQSQAERDGQGDANLHGRLLCARPTMRSALGFRPIDQPTVEQVEVTRRHRDVAGIVRRETDR